MVHAGFSVFGQGDPFQNDQKSMEHTKNNKSPIGAMPKPDEPHGQKNGAASAQASAQVFLDYGKIYIVRKPSCKRDMPALPKIGDAFCQIGEIEIFCQFKP